MAYLEEQYIVHSTLYPDYYRRYVDDIFCLFTDPSQAQQFLNFLNSVDPSTKFDIELESIGRLEFLDTVVSHTVNSQYPEISTRVKNTDNGLFYHFGSFIPDIYRRNLISCLCYRIYNIASSYHILHENFQTLTRKLLKNGFPRWLIELEIGKVMAKFYSPKPIIHLAPKKEIFMVLPFLGVMSTIYKRKICRLVHQYYPSVELRVVFKRGLRLSNLFSFKDKLPHQCKSGVVYYTQCEKCGPSQDYVGKTINTLYERFYDSNGHLNSKTRGSKLLEHMNTSGDPKCKFVFDNIKILDYSNDDKRLKYIESIHLKLEKQNLNTQEWSIPLKII